MSKKPKNIDRSKQHVDDDSRIFWRTEKRKIEELKPYPHNPRMMSEEQAKQLEMSLAKFDYVELVAINLDNTILAGHMRVNVMKKAKWTEKEVEVRVPNRLLTEEEAKEYIIRSNKNTGSWDDEILGNCFDVSDLVGWGFSTDDLGISIDLFSNKHEKEETQEKCPECGQKLKKKNKNYDI